MIEKLKKKLCDWLSPPPVFSDAERAAAQFQGLTVRGVDQQGWRERPSEWYNRMDELQPPNSWSHWPESDSWWCECQFRCTCCGKLVPRRHMGPNQGK